MIAEMMADMRAEYERREEVLRREIARLTLERDEALARTLPPSPQPRCITCGVAVALLALLVALVLPTRPAQVDVECASRLSACGDELQAMRESMVVVDTGEDYVCDLEGEGGYGEQ